MIRTAAYSGFCLSDYKTLLGLVSHSRCAGVSRDRNTISDEYLRNYIACSNYYLWVSFGIKVLTFSFYSVSLKSKDCQMSRHLNRKGCTIIITRFQLLISFAVDMLVYIIDHNTPIAVIIMHIFI